MTDLSKRKDITQFATSMLAGSRKRRDDMYQRSVDDRDRQASEARKRERKQLLYGYGAKAVLSIGNSMVRSATENFLNQEPVLQKNIKFKSAVQGATGRMNDRQQALVFEGGEEEFWRQKAAAELTTSFNKAVPTSYNATQREQLLYNETMKAGKELKKLYNSSADQDKLLLERVGTDGADAYTKALTTSRGTDVGSAIMRKFKGLFRQGGDPLDNSVKANELFKSSENVAAYGELRRAGLSPFKSEEKIKEWTKAAGGMSVGIVSNEIVKITTSVGSKYGEPKSVDQSFREIKLADGTIKIMSINTGSEVTPTDLTYVETAAKLIKNNPDQVEQHKVAVAQVLTVGQRDVLGKYNSLLVQDATDEDRVKAVANNQYAKIMITQDSLSEIGLRPRQSQELAAVMHVINTEGMLDEAGWGTSIREENNLLTDSKGYHPLVAYMAATDIEDGGTSSISFNDNVKRGFLTDYAQNSAFYDSKLSTQARSRVRTMLGDRPEAALALENILGVPEVPEPVVSTSTTPVAALKTYTEDEINKALKYHFRTNASKQKAALAGNLDQKTQIFNAVGGQSILDSDSRKQARTDKLVKVFKSASQKQKAINRLSATDKLVYDSLKSKVEKEKFLADKSGAV